VRSPDEAASVTAFFGLTRWRRRTYRSVQSAEYGLGLLPGKSISAVHSRDRMIMMIIQPLQEMPMSCSNPISRHTNPWLPFSRNGSNARYASES
jgi:hypothetical protein